MHSGRTLCHGKLVQRTNSAQHINNTYSEKLIKETNYVLKLHIKFNSLKNCFLKRYLNSQSNTDDTLCQSFYIIK